MIYENIDFVVVPQTVDRGERLYAGAKWAQILLDYNSSGNENKL